MLSLFSLAERPGVLGSRGLMLGDILGRSAGETWTELEPARFLFTLGANCGVRLAVPVEDDADVSCGLWPKGNAAPGLGNTGEGRD